MSFSSTNLLNVILGHPIMIAVSVIYRGQCTYYKQVVEYIPGNYHTTCYISLKLQL